MFRSLLYNIDTTKAVSFFTLKKIGIAFNRAKHFIRYADSIFQLNTPEPMRVKNLILSESNSKYLKVPQNQLTLF